MPFITEEEYEELKQYKESIEACTDKYRTVSRQLKQAREELKLLEWLKLAIKHCNEENISPKELAEKLKSLY